MISIDEYIKNMKEGQEQIFYIIGDSVEQLSSSPFVESLLSKDYEILYMTEPIDDYLVASPAFKTIEGKNTQNIVKSGVKLAQEDADKAKDLETKFEPLVKKLLKTLDVYISTARVSQQLTTSPCAVIATDMALSASMERLMKSRALSKKDEGLMEFYRRQKYIFEINVF